MIKTAFSPVSAKIAAALHLALCSIPAIAEKETPFPSRPITLTVPFGSGSTTDIYARVFAEALGQELKQPVIVDNRPGAGGSIGLGISLRAPADGYTMALVTTSTIAINAGLYPKLPYNPGKDISIIAIPSTTPNVLVISSSRTEKTYGDFERKMKDGLSHFYNSQGSGTSQHLLAVLLAQLTGIKAEHISYKGSEGITGMLGGQTEFAFASVPSVLSLVQGQKLNALAITGSKQLEALPNTPTLVSFGYKQFAATEVWYGFGVSSQTPASIKEKLATAISNVARLPRVQTKLAGIGFEPMTDMSSDALQKYVEGQIGFWGNLVRDSGAKAD